MFLSSQDISGVSILEPEKKEDNIKLMLGRLFFPKYRETR